MNIRWIIALMIAGFLAVGTIQTSAHHSFVAAYDETKVIKIEGKMVQFQFRNPHTLVQVDAPDDQGAMQRWTIEWGGAGQLANQGITQETLKSGDNLILTGNPGRTASQHRMRMMTLRRTTDGFSWGEKPGQTFQ